MENIQQATTEKNCSICGIGGLFNKHDGISQYINVNTDELKLKQYCDRSKWRNCCRQRSVKCIGIPDWKSWATP